MSSLLHLVCDDAASAALMACLDMWDTRTLRVAHPLLRDAVAAYQWCDLKTRFYAERVLDTALGAWRACFPRARALNMYLDDSRWLVNRSFEKLSGISTLCLHGLSHRCSVTNDMFAYLSALVSLDVSDCEKFTDAAFRHTPNLRVLKIRRCSNPRFFTDAAFAHLSALIELDVTRCTQFTNAAFRPLRNLRTLRMRMCNQRDLTDAVFEHMPALTDLDITGCQQFTDAAFVHLTNLRWLNTYDCMQKSLTSAALTRLENLSWLYMHVRRYKNLSDTGYVKLPSLAWAIKNYKGWRQDVSLWNIRVWANLLHREIDDVGIRINYFVPTGVVAEYEDAARHEARTRNVVP